MVNGGLNKRTVKLSGTTIKEIVCAECRTKYAFAVNRTVEGYGTSLYNADDEGAMERANENAQAKLTNSLENALELVPCPHCGAYQPDMVAFLKNAHLKWLYLPAAAFLVAGVIAGFLAYTQSSSMMMYSAATFILIAAGLIVFRLQAASNIDPNVGDPKERIELSRRLVLFNNPSLSNPQKTTQQLNTTVAPGEPPAMPSTIAGEPEIKDDMYVYALERLEKGQKARDVRKQIIEAGYEPSQADQIVQTALRYQREREAQAQQEASAYKAAGPRNMAIGGIICLASIVVTVGTMAMASEGGGRFILAWGAIVCGAIQFYRGLRQSTS
jgi:hypothetical protein